MDIIKKYYKEDFKILVTLPEGYNNEPFEVNVITGCKTYKAGYDGKSYTNCKVQGKQVLVSVGQHCLSCGLVEAEIIVKMADSSMPGGVYRYATRKPAICEQGGKQYVLVLHQGNSETIKTSQITIEGLADLIKGDAYVITDADYRAIAQIVLDNYKERDIAISALQSDEFRTKILRDKQYGIYNVTTSDGKAVGIMKVYTDAPSNAVYFELTTQYQLNASGLIDEGNITVGKIQTYERLLAVSGNCVDAGGNTVPKLQFSRWYNKEYVSDTAKKLSELEEKTKSLSTETPASHKQSVEIKGENGEVVVSITEEQCNVNTTFKVNGKEIKSYEKIKKSSNAKSGNSLRVTDDNGQIDYVLMNEEGVYASEYHHIDGDPIQFEWRGLSFAAYGDSLTELNGGDVDGETAKGWMTAVAGYFGFVNRYNRGIGGTWLGDYSSPGSPERVKYIYPNGSFVARNEGDTTSEKNVRVIDMMCRWDRIKKMFTPIKDKIALVTLMGGTNDFGSIYPNHLVYEQNGIFQNMPEWSSENTKDTEWINDTEYNPNGGDFDISTYSGAICSTIMKLQALMPNVKIVFMTPPYMDSVTEGVQHKVNNNGVAFYDMVQTAKHAANYMGCPVIDLYGECGINHFNADKFLQVDGTHLYNVNYQHAHNGTSLIARVIIGRLREIYPISYIEYEDNGRSINQ